jgi:hypothetical protein
MKIRLTKDLPMHPRYGLTEGREFECDVRSESTHWIVDDQGRDVRLWPHEFEIVAEDQNENR